MAIAGLAMDYDGDLFAAGRANSGGVVARISPGNAYSSQTLLPFGHLSNPSGVAVDDADADDPDVFVLDGAQLLELPSGATAPVTLPIGTLSNQATQLAADDGGDVFVADDGNHRVVGAGERRRGADGADRARAQAGAGRPRLTPRDRVRPRTGGRSAAGGRVTLRVRTFRWARFDDWSTITTSDGVAASEAIIDNWWRQGMMRGAKAHYDGIVAFSQTDFTEDLKKITVPVLVMHGDDDQIVPYADSGPLSAELVQNGTLKTYKGFPHGMPTTEAATVNADLPAFLES